MSTIEIHVHEHIDTKAITDALAALSAKVDALTTQGATQMADIHDVEAALAALNDKVTAEETVEQSAIALLQQLKTALDAALANANPTAALAAVQSISDKIGTDTQTIADAVTANTPAAPAPAPAP